MRPDLTGIVRAGDGILIGQACAEPQTLTEALVEQRASFPGARVFLGVNYSGIIRPGHADHLRLSAYCGSGHNRALAEAGVLDIHPHPYSRLGALIRERRIPCDVLLVQVSPPNARGEYSLGLAADYLIPALAVARAVVAEVNDRVPWTHTEKLFHREDFALVVPSSREPAAAPVSKSGELEQRIARHAAALVPEGATLEFGLGALPDAICAALGGKRLSVHSGTIGDGVADLLASGSVSAVTAAMLIGSRKLFEAARENPRIRLRSVEHTHDPRVLGALERFVAINSAIEVDLTGQVNAEVARGTYLGAVGGALDFVRAANQSPGGVSLLLLPAARIVETLQGPVATPRSEAGVIVTELGAADLRGCSLSERKSKLKAISKL
ncbi:MAG TPA: acetyl-CoA hydrolase/transferase C-terminal domain-containing protein [Burkholderiales bacterium]|nr:acetyl-CoA hydrolase/transferase C-terminal domain-containing protein [Burkholderiales bacterium]